MSNRMPSNADDHDESTPDSAADPRPLAKLTGFKRDQLFVIRKLAEHDPHGLVIKEELNGFYDEEINQARFYKNLGELVEEGYVEKRPIDGRTNAYRPSERGNERLEAHHEWQRRCLRYEH